MVAVIGNPIVVGDFPFRADKDDYLLWIGRIDDDKGAAPRDRRGARGRTCRWCSPGPVQPGQRGVLRSARSSRTSTATACGTSARSGRRSATCTPAPRALLMPIRWPEPFGLVMTEAMACGTPVIAFPEGSAPEVVIDGETGFVVDDEHAMAEASGGWTRSTRRAAASSAEERFDVAPVAAAYEAAYATGRERGALTHSLTHRSKGG